MSIATSSGAENPEMGSTPKRTKVYMVAYMCIYILYIYIYIIYTPLGHSPFQNSVLAQKTISSPRCSRIQIGNTLFRPLLQC